MDSTTQRSAVGLWKHATVEGRSNFSRSFDSTSILSFAWKMQSVTSLTPVEGAHHSGREKSHEKPPSSYVINHRFQRAVLYHVLHFSET
jgi:hypothetical protein